MGLALTNDHVTLAGVARSMLADRQALGAARAALDGELKGLPAFWTDVAALGWTGLHLPEECGGQGYGLEELAIVVEELGRVVAPGPFLPTVLASAVLAEIGTEGDRGRWLADLASGGVLGAVGLVGSLQRDGDVVTGDAGAVLGAPGADLLLLRVGDDLVAVVCGEGVAIEAHTAVDPTRPVGRVRCDRAPIAAVLVGGSAPARRVARVLLAAEAVGGMHACLEMSVAYAQGREQFGRPIGSFQAIKHHCADMLLAAELAAAAAWDAARGGGEPGEADLTAAVAATTATAGYLAVAERTIQVHGGIGYTWEHDAHLHLRRAAAISALVGPPESLQVEITELRRRGVRRRSSLEASPEAEAEREGARAFAAGQAVIRADERQRHWARSGYLVPHWPPPFGRGAGPSAQLVIDEELAAVERPSLGLGEWVIPTVLQHGTPEQVERWMWPSLEGELRWCQLFSEPGAGSDAAAITTKATRTDGGWIVNGQKVWTSQAHECQMGLATVRTDPEASKHGGITAMGIDLRAEGVTVRPLTEITGEKLFNEVFFDDVFVPDTDVIGDPGNGWRVARAALGNERISIGEIPTSMDADALLELLDRRLPGDTGYAGDVGALLAESQAVRMLTLRHAARAVAEASPGLEGNLAKLVGAEHAQRIVEVAMRIIGAAALVGEEGVVFHDFLYTRCLTIAGGTSEVLRNQIAERILGLPREPGPR